MSSLQPVIDWPAVAREFATLCDAALERYREAGKLNEWDLRQAVVWASSLIVQRYGYRAGIECLKGFEKAMEGRDADRTN